MSIARHPLILFGTKPTSGLWTPALLPGLVYWFDPAETYPGQVTTASGLITQVTDKSGNGYTVSQASGAKQPEYIAAALNGLHAARFTNDALAASGPLPISTALSVFAVTNAAAGDKRIVDQRGTGSLTGAALPGFQFKCTTTNGQGCFTVVGNSGNYRVVRFTSSWSGINIFSGAMDLADLAATQKLWLNGVEDYVVESGGTTAIVDITTTQPLTIGANANGQNIQFLTDDLGDIILTNAVLSESNRQKCEGYLAHKYGTTAKLPGGHPYISTPPTA